MIFLAVGGLNTVVGYGLFAIFLVAGLGSTAAVVLATVLGALFNFKSIGRLVFKRDDPRLLLRFLAVYSLQCASNVGLLRVGEAIGVSKLVAEAVILPVLAVAVFFAMRRFVFRSQDGGMA